MDSITFSPQRMLGDISVDCTIEETHTDTLMITEHPVEVGPSVTDHSYENPAMLTMRAGWSNSSAEADGSEAYAIDTYNALLALRATRQPFQVITGKRTYQNMLFASLGVTTDEKTEAVLMIVATLREIILVNTQATTLPPTANQATPQQTAAPTATGTVQPVPTSVTPAALTLV